MLKNPTSMKEILCKQNLATISSHIYPASLLDVSGGNCQRALVDESGMVRNYMGRTTDQK
jgi:tRNA A37 threonylcarbamoyltransferase TsaD